MKSEILVEWDFQSCSLSTDEKRVFNIIITRNHKSRIDKDSSTYRSLKSLKFPFDFNEFKILLISKSDLIYDSISICCQTEFSNSISSTYFPRLEGKYDPVTFAIIIQSVCDQLESRDLSEFIVTYKKSFVFPFNKKCNISSLIGAIDLSKLVVNT